MAKIIKIQENSIIEVKLIQHKNYFLDIYQDIFYETWNRKNFLNFLKKKNNDTYLLLKNKNSPIGVCTILNLTNEIEIVKFGIKPDDRNKGYGFIFLQLLINHYIEKNIDNIFLEVSVKNTAAIRLYSKLGFKLLNIREKYYKRNKKIPEDAYIMKRQINFF